MLFEKLGNRTKILIIFLNNQRVPFYQLFHAYISLLFSYVFHAKPSHTFRTKLLLKITEQLEL